MRSFRRVKAFVYIHHAELRTLVALLLVFLISAGDAVFAAGGSGSGSSDPWANITSTLITWITGNLGKLIALIGMIISTLIAIASHSFKPLAYGMIISVVIGGLVGLAKTFFDAGSTAFGTNW